MEASYRVRVKANQIYKLFEKRSENAPEQLIESFISNESMLNTAMVTHVLY